MTRVANAKLLDMVSVADVDTEERVDGSLVMILKLAEKNKNREGRGGKYFLRGEEKWKRRGRLKNIWIRKMCFFCGG